MPESLDWVVRAFWELDASRATGWGIGGIPFEAIDRWAERYGVQDFEAFHELIQAADAAYLRMVREKDDAGRPPSQTGRHRRRSGVSPRRS